MDKEKAARILAKELGDKLGRTEVIEGSYKDSLIKNASAVYQLDSPILATFYDDWFCVKKQKGGNIIDIIQTHKYISNSFTDANYYFLESVHALSNKYSDSRSYFTVTPYALIGGKEKTSLRKLFYKNVSPDIICAMKVLGIRNFVDFYINYADDLQDSFSIQLLKEDVHFMKEDLEVAKKFIDIVPQLKYDGDAEIHKKEFKKLLEDYKSLNVRFERIGVKTCIHSNDAVGSNFVTKATILRLVGELSGLINDAKYGYEDTLWNEFVDFVFFYLSTEEQNIVSNKKILNGHSDLDFVVNVLSKEYSTGNNFCEYFDVLNEGVQKKVVRALKNCPDKKPVFDSFLWSKGFKDKNLDYIDTYKKDANTFIQYFNKRSLEEKKIILKDIMNCDFINEDVANWLNQNEQDLLREVGFNG